MDVQRNACLSKYTSNSFSYDNVKCILGVTNKTLFRCIKMRLYSISILYFLLNYCIYAHDLNHAEPTTVKEPESAVFVDSRNQTSG